LSADETMGELVDLAEWKHQKELEEIERLQKEIREIQESEGLTEQSPYYPKVYFEPTEVDIYKSGQEVPEVEPPGGFQFDPLQSAIDYYSTQSTVSLPPVGPDAGLGPRVAYWAGEGVRDIIERVIQSEMRQICREILSEEEE
jgi:hypothetical protein